MLPEELFISANMLQKLSLVLLYSKPPCPLLSPPPLHNSVVKATYIYINIYIYI
jgi:hypothetical protein